MSVIFCIVMVDFLLADLTLHKSTTFELPMYVCKGRCLSLLFIIFFSTISVPHSMHKLAFKACL